MPLHIMVPVKQTEVFSTQRTRLVFLMKRSLHLCPSDSCEKEKTDVKFVLFLSHGAIMSMTYKHENIFILLESGLKRSSG